MSELGQLLKNSRLEKGFTLEQLESATKIRKRYLEAIEEGNYKVLPGNFYVRAFIKSYAEAVGLDPNEVLRMYQNVIPNAASEPATTEVLRRSRPSSVKDSDKGSRIATTFLMVAFVLLIIGIVYYFVTVNVTPKNSVLPQEGGQITDKKDPGDGATPTPVPNGSAAAPKKDEPIIATPTPTPTPVPSVAEVKLTDSVRGTDTYTITNAAKLTIVMKIKGDACWYQLDSLGASRTVVEQNTFIQGQPDKTFELQNSAFLKVGKSNAVEIIINGTPIVVGDQPNPKGIQLNLQKS